MYHLFTPCSFIVRIAILLWSVTYFSKEYFSFISALNTQSQLLRGTTCTNTFLSPNGNCSPTSSISLSWSSTIHRFFPRRRPRDNDCLLSRLFLSFFFRMLSDNTLESIGSRAFTIPSNNLLM